MTKDRKWIEIGAWFGTFICLSLLCLTIFFTPDFIANHFSSDGILNQDTIFFIDLVRSGLGILGTIGLIISALYIINPDIFIKSYSNPDQIWKKLLKLILFLLPVIYVICVVLIKRFAQPWYQRLMVGDDSVIEWLQFVFYFSAFVVSLSISITYYKNNSAVFCLMYILLTIGLFLIAGEEISWGQRIFHEHTPAFFMKYNYQKEMNLHNIKGVPLHLLYIIVGFYGAFSGFIVPKKVKAKYRSIVNLFVPEYYLFFYFFVVGILYFYYNYLSSIGVALFGNWFGWGPGHFITGKDQESAELLLSCGFLLFVIINKYRQVRSKNLNLVQQDVKPS